MYTADPAPMVYGDTLYLYTTHDEDQIINNFYTMKNWYVFSTKDMVNWEKHGQILSLDDIPWAVDRAWAPQCVERNKKFYFYFPVQSRKGVDVGVAVADSPIGPFKDIGNPLVSEGDWNDIDPTVFIDDDGQAYLYFGNPELRYVKLNEDMISYDKSVGVVKVPMTTEGLKAVKAFSDLGIRTNVTLVFSAVQALLAARAGATYVSPFLGRLDDIGHNGMDLIRQIAEIFAIHGIETEIIAASVRHSVHVTDAALNGAHIATIPANVIASLVKHPLTDQGIEKFLADWEKTQEK